MGIIDKKKAGNASDRETGRENTTVSAARFSTLY
jgi:hypothetical protein